MYGDVVMRRRNKKIHIVLILIVLFGISVGYAVINRSLNITGNSEVKQNTWNIYFDNVKVKEGSVTSNLPVIDTTTKSTVNFNVMLNLPGDFYEFTVDVVNSGTIDAMVDSVVKTPELTDDQKKYLNYIIEYENGEQITSKQLVSKNSLVRLKVRVEYKKDLTESDLPTITETLNLGFTLNYVQGDRTGATVKNNGIKIQPIANGLLDDIGTIVTIGDQQFYTIGTEGDNVKLLSMYNLYVGNKYDDENGLVPLADPTGKQSETARGFFKDYNAENPIIGTTAFSSDSQKGTNYSDYNGSIVEGYVNNYKTILENDYDVDVVEARLIIKEELTSDKIGCDEILCSCKKAPNFIYSTSYWSGSAYGTDEVWSVDSSGNFIFDDCNEVDFFGVRPVIILKKSDIVVEIKPVANGSLDDIGTVVTIGDQQFYTIGTEGDNVKLLSMYNLYVGNQYDDDNKTVALANPTGKQSETAKGWFSGYSATNPIIGATAFSNTNSTYAGSIVEGYVNNYKTILESDYGVDVVEARLITKDELISEEIGCRAEVYTCTDAPSFIYSTTYWSGSANNTNYVWRVHSGGDFYYLRYSYGLDIGVRPVIILKKSDIVVKVKPTANGSIDDIGTIVTIGTEQFYTIGTEGNNVKLLSMLNITLDDNLKQSSSSSTTAFSNTNSTYDGSLVESYANAYGNKLRNSMGLNVVESRLITANELLSQEIGCSDDERTCINTPYSWIYSTTYWTSSATNDRYVWTVNMSGHFRSDTYDYISAYGVRPVIVVSKSLF